ncbi:MAG: hypothetical protein U0996_14355 [Planctomycetaceae bacterium]
MNPDEQDVDGQNVGDPETRENHTAKESQAENSPCETPPASSYSDASPGMMWGSAASVRASSEPSASESPGSAVEVAGHQGTGWQTQALAQDGFVTQVGGTSDNPVADFFRFASRFLFTHNPFYVISAALFVWGLKLLFRVGDSSILFAQGTVGYMEPWGLMASLCGVTLLMAATAVIIVRLEARGARLVGDCSDANEHRVSFGSVWEDIRSLILIVLLMFPAISISFDELLTQASQSGRTGMVVLMFATGLGFLLVLMEVLIAGLQIRLAAFWRLPIYAVLALFFIWPLLLLPEWTGGSRFQVRWLIFLFPTAASLALLGLIPAIRQGKAAVEHNGTPWGWPWFPWTGIVFLTGTVIFRAYSLTIAFDPANLEFSYWDTSFGIYSLVPMGFCLLLLLVEIAQKEKNDDLRRMAYSVAPFLLIAACPWTVPWNHLPTYNLFVAQFVSVAGSPVFVTLCMLVVFYGVGCLRRIPGSEGGVLLCLMLATVIGPRTCLQPDWSFRDIEFQFWPLLPLALIQGIRGWNLRSSLRLMMSFGCVMLLAVKMMNGDMPAGVKSFLVLHVMLLALMIAAFRLADDFAEFLRSVAPVCFTGTILCGAFLLMKGSDVRMACLVYVLLMTLTEFSVGKVLQDPRFQKHAISLLCLGLMLGLLVLPVSLSRAQLAGGVRPVVFAGVSFTVAVGISVLKTGYRTVLALRWKRLRDWALS